MPGSHFKPDHHSDSEPAPASTTKPVAPQVFHDEGSDQVLVLGNCVIVFIPSTLSVNAVAAIESAFEQVVSRGEWIAYFSQVVYGGGKCDQAAQDKMAKVVAHYTKHISGAAIVYRGTGFRATAVRSLITAVHWASRATHPLKVFEDVGPALVWLKHQTHAESIDVTLLGSVVRGLGG